VIASAQIAPVPIRPFGPCCWWSWSPDDTPLDWLRGNGDPHALARRFQQALLAERRPTGGLWGSAIDADMVDGHRGDHLTNAPGPTPGLGYAAQMSTIFWDFVPGIAW